MGYYDKLVSPIKIKKYILKNRLVHSAVSTRMANSDGTISIQMLAHYSSIASGGVAVLVTETLHVDDSTSKFAHIQPAIYHDKFIPGLNNLSDEIRNNNCIAIAQIGHAGRQTSISIVGSTPVAPSMIPNGPTRHCHELGKEEINAIVERFAEAAIRAVTAGFHGIEIHAGNGYLINQFLSPYTNVREDEYGKERALLLREIIESVRGSVTADTIVGIRLGCADFVTGGMEAEDAVGFASVINDYEIDYIHTAAGVAESMDFMIPPIYKEKAFLRDVSKSIKMKTDIPVILTGNVNDPDLAEEVIAKGEADLIGMGRQLLTDPSLPNKIAVGNGKSVRPCIRCNQGCLNRVRLGNTIRCAVNPETGYEWLKALHVTGVNNKLRDKSVLIAGGGPAGITAAIVCAENGCTVRLFEKKQRLGGLLNTANAEIFKTDIVRYKDFLTAQVMDSKTEIALSQSVDYGVVEKENPDVFIDATGSLPRMPAVADDLPYTVVDARKFLMDYNIFTQYNNYIILGGGITGCEIGFSLASEKKKVIIFEKTSKIMSDVDPISALGMRRNIEEKRIDVRTNREFLDFSKEGIRINGETQNIHAEVVVVSMGGYPNNTVRVPGISKWKQGINYLRVGDADMVGNIYGAVHSSYWKIRTLLQNSFKRISWD